MSSPLPAAPGAGLVARWQAFVDDAARPRCRTGASVMRLVAGATILVQYLLNYEQRRYLYGPQGVWPFATFIADLRMRHGFSVYAWSASPLWFEVVYHLSILVALAWFLGYRTRLLTPVLYVLWSSLHQRFLVLWDGGDNAMQLTLIFGCFADLSARFSIDEQRRAAAPVRPWQRDLGAMLHNGAMLAIAVQLALVYGVAGLTKVQGESWRNGTALYYALRAGEFAWPGKSEHIYHSATLLTALAYATVAFQVSFPFLLFLGRRLRVVALVSGLFFHLGIASFMGLITFAGFLVAIDLSLLADEEYAAFARALRAVGRRLHFGPPAMVVGEHVTERNAT
jgi:hypothetical protein